MPSRSPRDATRPGFGSLLATGGVRVFLVGFVLFFGAGAIWSAAVPLLGGPDEPSHMVKAAAVAHGELTALCYHEVAGKCLPAPQSALGLVTLPQFYSMIRSPDLTDPANSQICFHAHSTIPASCARSLNRKPDATDVACGCTKFVWSYAARYPPLYYFLVGQPSHLGGSTIDLYLMRLVSAALGALFLALAATAALVYSRNRLLLLGLLAAATPMVLFLDGVVNPSGLEVAAAIALWTTGAILVTERLSAPPPGLVAMLGISAIVFESIRSLSPLWLALDVAVLLAVAPPRALLGALRRRSIQICGVAVALVGGGALWWIVTERATDVIGANPVPKSVPYSTILETSLRHNGYWVPTMVGIFGWFDARSPTVTYVLWYALVALLLLGALRATTTWRRVVLVGYVLCIAVIPALISASQAHVDGYLWSGRDTMPFAMGLPILAAALLGTSEGGAATIAFVQRRIVWITAIAAFAQFAAFYEAMRRWAVGTNGSEFGFLLHPSWQPAIEIVPALILEALALAGLASFFTIALRTPLRNAPEETSAETVRRSALHGD